MAGKTACGPMPHHCGSIRKAQASRQGGCLPTLLSCKNRRLLAPKDLDGLVEAVGEVIPVKKTNPAAQPISPDALDNQFQYH
ncbi:MAG: hypothetical protein KKE73_06980 [Proteobacteria bacterium]|nr:hypothetical protein [Pseudomonadota bacterium]